MSGHWPHKGDPAMLLFPSCSQCDDLSKRPAAVIGAMEPDQFEAGWARAVAWTRGLLDEVSAAEIPVLEVFVVLCGQFAKRGVPWGTVPAGEKAGSAAAA